MISLNYGRTVELRPNGRAYYAYHLLPVGKTNVKPFCGRGPVRSNAISHKFRIDKYYELRPIGTAFGGRDKLCPGCLEALKLL